MNLTEQELFDADNEISELSVENADLRAKLAAALQGKSDAEARAEKAEEDAGDLTALLGMASEFVHDAGAEGYCVKQYRAKAASKAIEEALALQRAKAEADERMFRP